MPVRRARRFTGNRAQRRQRIWGRETHSTAAVATTGDAQLMLQDFSAQMGWQAGNAPPGTTIGGLKYRLVVRTDTASPGFTVGSALIYGFIVDSSRNATEVPRPAVDRHADWLEWGSVPLTGLTLDQVRDVDEANGQFHTVRSMRRMEEISEQLWFVAELTGVPAATAVGYGIWVSTLLLLP